MKLDVWVFLKGMLMGAADIVPGVSGGTIAFITGIYERLIFAIKEVPQAFWRLLKERHFASFWRAIDGGFLLTLFIGILTSVAIFARLITYLLQHHPIPLWAFFFGLIVASVWIVGRQIPKWDGIACMSLIMGIALAWLITSAAPIQLEPSLEVAFFSGMIAICAMILPGISGSFILVILGTYAYVLGSIKGLDFAVLGVFSLGCLVGLLSIANLLSWAFKHYASFTLALLTGFMIGALNKVWPWKEVLSFRTNRHGESVPLLEQNVLPSYYEDVLGLSSEFGLALMLSVVALVVVIFLDRFARQTR